MPTKPISNNRETNEIVRKACEERKIDAQKLANALHCSRQYAQMLMSGRRKIPSDRLKGLCVLLDIPFVEFRDKWLYENFGIPVPAREPEAPPQQRA